MNDNPLIRYNIFYNSLRIGINIKYKLKIEAMIETMVVMTESNVEVFGEQWKQIDGFRWELKRFERFTQFWTSIK